MLLGASTTRLPLLLSASPFKATKSIRFLTTSKFLLNQNSQRSTWSIKTHTLLNPSKSNLLSKFNYYKAAFKRTYATHHQLSYRLNQQRNNNSYRSLLRPLIFTGAFSVGTLIATPFLFENTPLKYFKRHPQHLLYTIIGLNVAVFGLWFLRYQPSMPISVYRILTEYFLLDRSPSRRSQWAMLFSAFSHQEFFHLLINMGCLYSFGSTMINVLGVDNFTSFYLISAVASSFASIAFSFVTKSFGTSLGASGAISGVFASFATIFPKAGVSLFVFPIPGGAQVALLGFTAYNLAGMILKWGSYDFAAHLGGTAMGILYGYWVKQRIQRRRERMGYR